MTRNVILTLVYKCGRLDKTMTMLHCVAIETRIEHESELNIKFTLNEDHPHVQVVEMLSFK